MRQSGRWLCASLFLLLACRHPRHALPAFSDYPTADTSTAPLTHIDIPPDSSSARWLANLTPLIGSRPNFAGHYVATDWPAGWPVGRVFALVDVRTGRAWVTRLDPIIATEYRLASTLLLVDPAAQVHAALDDTTRTFQDVRDLAWTFYYRWDGERFTKLDSTKVYP